MHACLHDAFSGPEVEWWLLYRYPSVEANGLSSSALVLSLWEVCIHYGFLLGRENGIA